MQFIKTYFYLLATIFISTLVFLMSVKVTSFRYDNFEYGKFDLGNMSQMVFNTSRGNFMEVTDYFGTNMPRWGMSHVDPFLISFVPIYWVFPDTRVLIFGQLFLVIFSSVFLYLIGEETLKSKPASLLIAIAYLFYPALGYLLAWTGFHGVTAVMPFFFAAFYVYEYMHNRKTFTKRNLVIFTLLIFITLTGKEEISLITLMYGLFILAFRKSKVSFKVGLSLVVFSIVWFAICFLVLIPHSAHYRIDGFKNFAQAIELTVDPSRDVLKPNYFISRYEAFGDSYSEIVINMILNPIKVGEIFFSGDKKENFSMTFSPLLFVPLFYLPILVIAAPEFLINYMTTAGGIGTSEIYNHRISMIIPLLFISVVFAIRFFEDLIKLLFKTNIKGLSIVMALAILVSNIYFSNKYQNPVMLWFSQSLLKRITLVPSIVYAQAPIKAEEKKQLSVGDKEKINRLETKDRTCFNGVVDLIPDNASVSAPDYLGAHLANRRVNALFPANFNTADYVVVDVFSKKVFTILGVDPGHINGVVGKIVKDPNYKVIYSCSNVFVFQKVGPHDKTTVLPLQEEFEYTEKYNFNIGSSLHLVDFELPETVEKSKDFHTKFVYKKKGSDSLNAYIVYTTFRNKDSGKVYQIANLPSFGIKAPSIWTEDLYYIEDNNFVLPTSLKSGKYEVFVGITNNVKTGNVFIGNITLK